MIQYRSIAIVIIINDYYYTVGIPLNAVAAFGFHVGTNSRRAAKIRCGDTAEADDDEAEELEVELSQCSISISTASSEGIAGVRCFEPGKLFFDMLVIPMQHIQ